MSKNPFEKIGQAVGRELDENIDGIVGDLGDLYFNKIQPLLQGSLAGVMLETAVRQLGSGESPFVPELPHTIVNFSSDVPSVTSLSTSSSSSSSSSTSSSAVSSVRSPHLDGSSSVFSSSSALSGSTVNKVHKDPNEVNLRKLAEELDLSIKGSSLVFPTKSSSPIFLAKSQSDYSIPLSADLEDTLKFINNTYNDTMPLSDATKEGYLALNDGAKKILNTIASNISLKNFVLYLTTPQFNILYTDWIKSHPSFEDVDISGADASTDIDALD